MSGVTFGLRYIWRDLHQGGLRLLMLAVFGAVLCLTAVQAFIQGVEQALEQKAGELLGGDRVISHLAPVPDSVVELAQSLGLRSIRTVSFVSMLRGQNTLLLTQVKAAPNGYPLRGELLISDALDSPSYPTATVPTPNTVWLEPRALRMLDLQLGDTLTIGRAKFKITHLVQQEPDRVGDGFSFAPRALIGFDDIAKTGILQPGARVSHKLLLSGPPDRLQRFDVQVPALLTGGEQIANPQDARPALATTLKRGEQYLALAMLVNLILAGVAISMAAHHYAEQNVQTMALLRSLGAKLQWLQLSFGVGILGLSLAVGALASLAGIGLIKVASHLFASQLPLMLPVPVAGPLLLGLSTTLALVAGFALPPLFALTRTPPQHIFKQTFSASAPQSRLATLLALGLLGGILFWQIESASLTLIMLGGTVLVGGLAAGGCAALIARLERYWPQPKVVTKLVLRNLARHARANGWLISALGLSIAVALALSLVRTDLLTLWQQNLPAGTPNNFLINIQANDVEAIQAYFERHQIQAQPFYPTIRGTLVAINGDKVVQTLVPGQAGRRGYHRPLNLSYTQALASDNRIQTGRWFRAEDTGQAVISVEASFADKLGLNLGDTLEFQVGSRRTPPARIISIRQVEWDSFHPNFFVLFPPGNLESYPQTQMTSVYLPATDVSISRQLVQQHPAISIINTDAILHQVRSISTTISLVIGFIWQFTLVITIIILIILLLTHLQQRRFEYSLLRALGANGSLLQKLILFELGLLGGVSGLLGALLAMLTGAAFATQVLNLAYPPRLSLIGVGVSIGVVIVVLGGSRVAYRAKQAPPGLLLS